MVKSADTTRGAAQPGRRVARATLWSEFQDIFSEYAKVCVQAFDAKGVPVEPSPALPALCSFFLRYPETSAACRRDCFKHAAACRDSRRTLAARCHAGLSYRVVPIRRRNRAQAVVIVGRVLSEVFGGEQFLGFIERYHLPREAFLESLAAVRSFSAADLDRTAAFVRRAANALVLADSVAERRRVLMARQRTLVSVARRADDEARLIGQMAEKCLTARSLEELLPFALEAAMCSLRARRGSILLAEEQGKITARALRGEHSPISGTIQALRPGSVSHEVFFNRRPLLVQDASRERAAPAERQYPYQSRSFISVPLRDNGSALGVLQMTEREGAETFTEGDLTLLERLSRQAAGAICRVRLAEEVQSLRVASLTDHLTGVHNRRFLEEQLQLELQRARRFNQPLAVAMVDVDDFKSMNDQLGHDHGDRVLREIATTMRGQLRSVDVLARYGGDEFAMILPGTDAAGALTTIEKIRERLASWAPEGAAAAPRRFTISAGLTGCSGAAQDADEVLRRADEALLQAKKAGKNAALLWNG